MTLRPTRSPTASIDLEDSGAARMSPGSGRAAGGGPPWVEALRRNQVVACLAYSTCSVSMVLANKALASLGGSSSAAGGGLRVLPVAFQNLCSVVLLEALRGLGLVHYSWLDGKSAQASAPLGCCFVAMLVTGFMSLRHLSVPLVTVFKNMTNLLIVLGEWQLYQQAVSSGVLLSLVVMISGAALAAQHDLSFSLAGYAWMAANCLATAGYVLYLRQVTRSQSDRYSVVFFNNFLSLVLLLLLASASGELTVSPGEEWSGPGLPYWLLAVGTGVVAFVLNFASLWCVGATSATTYAIVGSLNKVPVVLLGHVLFHTVLSPESWLFVAVSLTGGFLYSHAKLQEDKARQKAKSKSELDLPGAEGSGPGRK